MSDIVDFVSPNSPDLPNKEQVILLCTKQGQGRRENHLIHVHNNKKLFIKYEVPLCEWKNQQFLFHRIGPSAAFRIPSAAFRIPEIYPVFGISDRLYLVMEFIQTENNASDIQRARAISDLVSIEA